MSRLTRAISACLDYTAPIAYGLRCWAACLRRERVETEPDVIA